MLVSWYETKGSCCQTSSSCSSVHAPCRSTAPMLTILLSCAPLPVPLCRLQGRVAAPLSLPHPLPVHRPCAPMSATLRPRCASCAARYSPAGPQPTTATSEVTPGCRGARTDAMLDCSPSRLLAWRCTAEAKTHTWPRVSDDAYGGIGPTLRRRLSAIGYEGAYGCSHFKPPEVPRHWAVPKMPICL